MSEGTAGALAPGMLEGPPLVVRHAGDANGTGGCSLVRVNILLYLEVCHVPSTLFYFVPAQIHVFFGKGGLPGRSSEILT